MHLFGTSQLFGQALGVWRGTEGAPHHRVGQRGLGGEHAEKKKKKKELTGEMLCRDWLRPRKDSRVLWAQMCPSKRHVGVPTPKDLSMRP